MRPAAEYEAALDLIQAGLSPAQIARKLAIPARTAYPQELILGLILTDGNRHINKVRGRFNRDLRYEYTRYLFTDASADILGIFTHALDRVGVRWTKMTPRVVSVARRDDVAFLDTFVGPKS